MGFSPIFTINMANLFRAGIYDSYVSMQFLSAIVSSMCLA